MQTSNLVTQSETLENICISTLTSALQKFLDKPDEEHYAILLTEYPMPILFQLLIQFPYEKCQNPNDVQSLLWKTVQIAIMFTDTQKFIMHSEMGRSALMLAAKSVEEISRVTAATAIHELFTKFKEALVHSEIIDVFITLFLDEEIAVANTAYKTFVWLASNHSDEAIRILNLKWDQLQRALKTASETCQMRCFGYLIGLSRQSNDIFSLVKSKKILLDLVAYLDSDDILLNMNAIQLFEELTEVGGGLDYMWTSSIAHNLVKQLENEFIDDAISISILYMIVHVIEKNDSATELLTLFKNSVLRKFEDTLEDQSNVSGLICAITCFGIFTKNTKTSEMVKTYCPNAAQNVANFVGSSTTDLSLSAITAWTEILNKLSLSLDGCILSIILEKVLPKVLSLIVAKPFPEFRTACYNFLCAGAEIKQFVTITFKCKELREIIRSTSTEQGSESAYAKHNFVKAALYHHDLLIKELTDAQLYDHLIKYKDHGAFYVTPGHSIATE